MIQLLNFDIIYKIANKHLDPRDVRNLLNSSREFYQYKEDHLVQSMMIKKNFKYFGIKLDKFKVTFGLYLYSFRIYEKFKHFRSIDAEDILEDLVENQSDDEFSLVIIDILVKQVKQGLSYMPRMVHILKNSTSFQKIQILTTMTDIPDFMIDYLSSFQEIIKLRNCKLLEAYNQRYKDAKSSNKMKISIIIKKESVKNIVENGDFRFLNTLVEILLGDMINMNLYIKAICGGIINMKKASLNEDFKKFLGFLNNENREKVECIMKINFDVNN
jgi:hypothetical protein